MRELKGIYSALVTPFTDSGEVDEQVLARIVAHQLDAGVDGFYVSGGTGEGILQTVPQRARAVRVVMDQVAGRAGVIAHVGATAAQDAVELAGQAAALGVDAVSALPPIFYKVPFGATLAYYSQVAQAARVPMLAYYIPGVSGISFSVAEFAQLLAVPHMVGVKFSDYNLFVMSQVRDLHPSAVIMSGNDEVMLAALTMGAHGAIGLTLNLMPKLYVRIYQAHGDGQMARARELQYKANRVIHVLMTVGPGAISVVKPVMKMIGFDCGEPRGPLPPTDRQTCDQIHRALDDIGFFGDPDYGVAN